MYDLSACIEACLKVIIAMFYFCHSNHSSNTMKNITEKLAHYKTSRTLKCDVFKIPDNKNIEKLFSKYEVIFLDQASSGSNPS